MPTYQITYVCLSLNLARLGQVLYIYNTAHYSNITALTWTAFSGEGTSGARGKNTKTSVTVSARRNIGMIPNLVRRWHRDYSWYNRATTDRACVENLKVCSYFVGPVARDRTMVSARVTIQIKVMINTPVPTPNTTSAILTSHAACSWTKEVMLVFRKCDVRDACAKSTVSVSMMLWTQTMWRVSILIWLLFLDTYCFLNSIQLS